MPIGHPSQRAWPHARGAPVDESIGKGKEAIFNYFAGEIFDGAKMENQRILMLTALAPSITPQEAVAITGSEEAPRLLECLRAKGRDVRRNP